MYHYCISLGKEGDEAYLDSPFYHATPGQIYCISFRYVLSAFEVGELRLYVVDNDQHEKILWRAYDMQGIEVSWCLTLNV